MPRILTRIFPSSSFFAILGVIVWTGPVSVAAQGARARGEAPVRGQAVPRTGTERGVQGEARAPQPENRRAEPTRSEAPATRVPPPRRVDFPNATAVPRPPQVIIPPGVVSQAVQPQIARPQIGTLHPTDHPDFRPDNRSSYQRNYRPQYVPNYRPLYRPDYRSSYRPYYMFRPRVRLGFGLWIGYPVAYPTYFYPSTPYPYAYTSPYPMTYPNSYPTEIYPPPATTAAAVGAAGGLSFDITPPEAGVYLDGYYMGTVSQFSPNQPPLALAPGRHHVEIREPGFEIIAFDVDILPGQVIPYQGDLRRL